MKEKIRIKFKKSVDLYGECEIDCVFVDEVLRGSGREAMQYFYTHAGQHSYGSKRYFDSRPYATRKEYAPLLKEMTGNIGYDRKDLKIVEKKKK